MRSAVVGVGMRSIGIWRCCLTAAALSMLGVGAARALDARQFDALVDAANADGTVAAWSYDKATDFFSDGDTRSACRFVAIYLKNQGKTFELWRQLDQVRAPDQRLSNSYAVTRLKADFEDRTRLFSTDCVNMSAADSGFDKTIAALRRIGESEVDQANLAALAEQGPKTANSPSCRAARNAAETYLSALDEVALTSRQSAGAAIVARYEASLRGSLADARTLLSSCPSFMQP